MCGICAFLGCESGIEQTYDGILMLQNRGYDSVGISSIMNSQVNNTNQIIVNKYASTPQTTCFDLLKDDLSKHENSQNIIMHTRWATHGPKADENSHPHIENQNKFALVHNGIIENYAELKKELISKYNINFKSQTDTEVIVNLISVIYNEIGNIEEAIKKALSKLKGTWGLVIQCIDIPDSLFCVRHGSPLLVGFNSNYVMIASEQSGFSKYINNYICLDNNDLVILTKRNGKIIFEQQHNYEIKEIDKDNSINLDYSSSPEPYHHWTIKEIYEQYDAVFGAMNQGSRIYTDYEVKLGGLNHHTGYLKEIDHLIILGCGTSYNAGLYSLNIFKQISGLSTVQIFDGAEFTKYDIPKSGQTVLVFLSQSGETRDLVKCLDIAKENNIFTIGAINVVDSLISREVNCGIYLNCGREVAVASTKVFTSQVVALYLMAVYFAQIKKINENKRLKVIQGLRKLPFDIRETLNSTHTKCKDIAKYLYDKKSVFILGKSESEAIAKEGSLKLKEIAYIHAEGYSSSALKHGTYALIEEGYPIIIVSPNDEYLSKNNSTIEELSSRHSYIIGISDTNISPKANMYIKIPTNKMFTSLLSVIVLQLVAYELALLKGHNMDYPKNLAKCVTTD
jgi:glucosamine--fructose-6-phosphate aminotransferase (isomerizing)